MQEGTLALMQLAKTLAAIERAADGGRAVHLASCRTPRPVACSPRSPRSATSTSPSRTRSSGSPARGSRPGRSPRSCRPGFQRAEFLFSHGFVDRVVARPALRDELIAPAAAAARPRPATTGANRPTTTCRLPAAVVPARRSPTGSASWLAATAARRHDGADGLATGTGAGLLPPTPTAVATAPGRGSSSRATCGGRGRSSSSAR